MPVDSVASGSGCDAPGLSTGSQCVAELYRRHHVALVGYLVRLSRSRELAGDIAQQVWLKLLQARAKGRSLPFDHAEIRAYLFRIARNVYIDECLRRSEAVRTTAHSQDDLDTLSDKHHLAADLPEDLVGATQLREFVLRAMALLPRSQAEVIELWMQGATIKSMAAKTRAARDTVLSRKKYGLKKLRHALAELR